MNSTYPQSLTAPGSFPVFKLDPMDSSCVMAISGDHVGAKIRFETSIDNGVSDPWSPAPALREATLALDSSDEGAEITLADGQTYAWRVSCLNAGSYIRCTVTELESGTITQPAPGPRTGRFFLDAPASLTIPVGAFASANQTNLLIALLRVLIAYTAKSSEPAWSTPNFQIVDQLIEQLMPGLVDTLPAQ